MELTAKQNESIYKSLTTDKRFIGNVGAVGSGKSVVNNIIFLAYLDMVKHDPTVDSGAKFIIAGWSLSAIENNVISPLESLGARVHRHKTDCEINGVPCVFVYTGSSRGNDSVQGVNACGAYVNEAVLAKEEVFGQIVQRVRVGKLQKILYDANPSSPNHWLKRKYIDTGLTEYSHFTIYDNPYLSKEYVETIEKTNKGDLFKRNVLGEWAVGNGLLPFQSIRRSDIGDGVLRLPYVWGIDLGGVKQENDPTVYVKVFVDNRNKNLIVTQAQFRYGTTIDNMMSDRVALEIKGKTYIDTNFPQTNAELMNRGWRNLMPIKKGRGSREAGIKKMQEYTLYIADDLVELIEEIDNFGYKDNGELMSEHDHGIDALRYAVVGYNNTENNE